jgi:hypothetical protein
MKINFLVYILIIFHRYKYLHLTHRRCMIMLYRGLVGSVLEYGSVCYSGMARTHMLRLERVQYRGIGNPEQQSGGPQWHSTSGGKIFVPELQISCGGFLLS